MHTLTDPGQENDSWCLRFWVCNDCVRQVTFTSLVGVVDCRKCI